MTLYQLCLYYLVLFRVIHTEIEARSKMTVDNWSRCTIFALCMSYARPSNDILRIVYGALEYKPCSSQRLPHIGDNSSTAMIDRKVVNVALHRFAQSRSIILIVKSNASRNEIEIDESSHPALGRVHGANLQYHGKYHDMREKQNATAETSFQHR